MSRALLTYLKIYDKFLDKGFDKAGPLVKEQAYKFFKLLTRTEDPGYDFIKDLPDRFLGNANLKFNIKNTPVFNYEEALLDIGGKYIILDGKGVKLDYSTKYTYGLGFTQPEEIKLPVDNKIDNAQIVTDEPVFIMITENNVMQDIKLPVDAYTAIGLDKLNPIKTTTQVYAELIADLKSQYVDGIYDEMATTINETYMFETEVVGEYDKKDTYSNPDDLYKILSINKVRTVYVKPEHKHFILYDTITNEELLKLNTDGTIYNGAQIDIYNEILNLFPRENAGIEEPAYKFIVTASVDGEPLTVAEIKADPDIVTQIEEAIKNYPIIDDPDNLRGASSKFHNIIGATVLEQPFAGLPDQCIIMNSYDMNEVVQYLESFSTNGISHINHYGAGFKILGVTKTRTADFTYLTKEDNTRDSNKEIIFYKIAPKDNQAFIVKDISTTDEYTFVESIDKIHLIFRENAEFTLDVQFLGKNKSANDLLNEGATGVLEIVMNTSKREESISEEPSMDGYSDSYSNDLIGYTDGIYIHKPIKVTTGLDNYNTSVIVLDTRNNGIKQDVEFEIKAIEIEAEEPVTEIRLEDIEVTIEKIV